MLNHISLFNDLNQKELEYLSKITTECSFKRGEFICQQGEVNHDFYVIKHGQVEISIMDMFKEKKILNILKNGEFFGEMALFDKESARSATAMAFQNTTLYKIPGRQFEALLKDQPSISFKLLGTMSKRLKEFMVPQRETRLVSSEKLAKVVSVCAPRDGYGKTTMATTLAMMLSTELPRKVLLVDLDLSYGDSTFLMGVYSPKSIVDLANVALDDHISEETVSKFLFKLNPSLSVLPAPKDLVEGERLRTDDFVKIINSCRKYYDYVVIDTSSPITDHLLNALDMSDQILFLVDVKDAVTLKSNTLFFQALSRLNLPESHVCLLMNHQSAGAQIEHYRKLFQWRIIGQLPKFEETKQETGHLPYQIAPSNDYCNSIRMLAKVLLKEEGLQVMTEQGLLSRWFTGSKTPGKLSPMEVGGAGKLDGKKGLVITEENCGPILKEIRGFIAAGFLDKAQEECSQLIGMCQKSTPMLRVLGEIFFLKKDYARALDVFDKVIALDPEDAFALGHLGHLQGNEDLKARSLQILTAKMAKSPEFPDVMNEMGKMFMLFGRYDEALEVFQKALKGNPGYIDARVNLALCYGETGRFGEGIVELMGIENKSTRVYYLLGTFLFHTARYYESMAAFTKVSEINPHYSDTDDRLDSLREYFSKINNLLEMHKRLARQSPNYPDIHLRTGNLYLLVGRKDEAIKEYEEALKLKPDYQEAKKKMEEVQSAANYLTEGFFLELEKKMEESHQNESEGKSSGKKSEAVETQLGEDGLPVNEYTFSNTPKL